MLVALRLARSGRMGFAVLWRGFGAAYVVVSMAQAALFLLQKAGIVRAYGVFTAGRMVPSRFVPIYEMYNMAAEVGDTATAAALAREMLSKPVKVPSREMLEIIEEVRCWETAYWR